MTAIFCPSPWTIARYTYSAGKIPGGFFKREGRPSEREILTSRLIDRPLRPLFPEAWRNETQIVAMVLSADSENDPDVIAVTAASAAAFVSDLPFTTPIAAVRVGLLDGKLVANPTRGPAEDQPAEHHRRRQRRGHRHGRSRRARSLRRHRRRSPQFGHEQIKRIIAAIRELHDQAQAAQGGGARRCRSTKPWPRKSRQKYGERLHDALDTAKHPKKESYSLRGRH